MVKELHPSLQGNEFSLDSLIFPPLRIPDFEVSEVNLTSSLTKRLTLKVPLMSSPMDTVTGHKMAILMALQGGIGVIHYNFPTIEDQMEEVKKVHRYEAAFVIDPKVIGPDATVGDVNELASQNGFYSYPITQDGTLETPMLGIVTHRDIRFREDPTQSVTEVMTPIRKMVVAHRRDTLDIYDIRAANKIIRKHNLDTLPIVDDECRVVAIVTDSDLSKDQRYPLATKDVNKQLKKLVAVESRLKPAQERIRRASETGANGIVVDARNIFADHLTIARWTRQNFPDLDIILGNVVTGEVVRQVMDEVGDCVDAFRVGIGGGEVCTTTEALGIGRALGSAIYDISQTLKPYKEKYGHIGIIADGGIKSPHHIVAALILGADAVMMGTELAGLDESPQSREWRESDKKIVKKVRGMGSASAIRERQGANRYMVAGSEPNVRYPEGIEKVVPYKGEGEEVIQHIFAGVRQAMHGLGHRAIKDLQENGIAVPWIHAPSKGVS